MHLKLNECAEITKKKTTTTKTTTNKQVNESLLQYRYPGYAFAIGEQKTVVFVYEMSKAVSSIFV